MAFRPGPRIALLMAIALPCGALAGPGPNPLDAAAQEHLREELGVNAFTAPSIGQIFEELNALKPIPFDKVWRDLPSGLPASRGQLALAAGGVIADGFLAVVAEKQSRTEAAGRNLLRLAKALGVGDHVARHSQSILEKSMRNQWADLKTELSKAQTDAEAGLMGLKDEEIAHLVSLGGWVRGMEITAGIVAEAYTPERASRLIQPDLLDYFLDRTKTLHPDLKKAPFIQILGKNLGEIRAIMARDGEAAPSIEEVKKIRNLSREINKAVLTPEEP